MSYGDYDYDGRLRELHTIAMSLGRTRFISRGSEPHDPNHCIVNDSYPRFIRAAVEKGKSFGEPDVLFLDNRKSILPGLILKRRFPNAKIILDCRELYLPKYVKHLAGKIGCVIERWGIRKADILICANEARASFMEEYYKLGKRPLVYENLRALAYSSPENEAASKEKFRKYDTPGEFRIISTSGCELSRMNDVLVENLPKVQSNCRLFLVGDSLPQDVSAIRGICEKNGIRNVEIIGKLNQDDLKALIGYCHIGIVNYHQKDLNNKYCASGKLYEFLFEGKPVVTTTNPPLADFCEKHHVGRCSDVFYDAINDVLADYAFYQKEAAAFALNNPVSANNSAILKEIAESMDFPDLRF